MMIDEKLEASYEISKKDMYEGISVEEAFYHKLADETICNMCAKWQCNNSHTICDECVDKILVNLSNEITEKAP